MELITGENLKEILHFCIKNARRQITCISPFVTEPAVEWLKKIKPEGVGAHIITRLHPSDVSTGATSLNALKLSINLGWKVSYLPVLHAKIYSIDENRMFVGSANLTSNGLKISGTGNLEASVEIPASDINIAFIKKIEESAIELTALMLQKVQEFSANASLPKSQGWWPEFILPTFQSLWVENMLWVNPLQGNFTREELEHDLRIIGIHSFEEKSEKIKVFLINTRCIQWLFRKLTDATNNELHFGTITALLHSELSDDPIPYRKNVKSLTRNLISYCIAYLQKEVIVTTPRHSQLVKLLVTSETDL